MLYEFLYSWLWPQPKAQALVLARAQPQALKPTSGPSSGLHDTRSRPPGYTPRQGLTGTNSERHSHSPSPPENKAAAKSVGKRPRPESATPKPAPKKRQATIAQQPYATPNPRIGPSHRKLVIETAGCRQDLQANYSLRYRHQRTF